jgi:hypothetical protein
MAVSHESFINRELSMPNYTPSSTKSLAPLLRELFAATPLAIFAGALREILQSRRRGSVTVPLGTVPR